MTLDKEEVVIFVLAGRTDLLVVKDGVAQQIAECDTRKFHEILEKDPEASAKRIENGNYEKHRGAKNGNGIRWEEIGQTDGLHAGKTLPLVQHCKDHYRPVAVVVLNSRRDANAGPFAASEPIAVGPVIANWMAEKLGDEWEPGTESGEIGKRRAGWLNFLDGKMELYEPGSKVLNLEGMQRIEDAVKRMACLAERVVIFEGGGFPQIKETVRELLRVHFRDVVSLQVPENSNEASEVELIGRILPEESYKARFHAIGHIRRGDYLAAYASASHVLGKGKDDSWLQELEQAANFFLGEPVDMDRAPGNAALKELVAIERQHYCVAAALRTEAHMRAGRTVEALLGVSSFFDVMLLERIRKYLGLLVAPGEFPCPQDGDTDALALAKSKLGAEFAGLCKQDRRGGLRIQNHAEAVSGWVEKIGFDPLREFHKSLNPDETKGPGLKAFRNKAIHGRLDPVEAQDAKKIMETAGLWSSTNRSPFLGQPLIKCLLQELGLESLDQHYQALENQLITILKEHRLAS